MKIDAKARVAIGAILDVAIHGKERPVRLADIGARQGVSKSYLEHLFKRLVHGGFVTSVLGPGGGYRLNGCLAVVSVVDIVGAVDTARHGQDSRRDALRHTGDESAITAALWCGLDDYLYDYLRTVSLESLLAGAVDAADGRERESVVVAARARSSSPRQSVALGSDASHQVAP